MVLSMASVFASTEGGGGGEQTASQLFDGTPSNLTPSLRAQLVPPVLAQQRHEGGRKERLVEDVPAQRRMVHTPSSAVEVGLCWCW